MSDIKIKKVLIISAHPDDFELGMGMRIKKYVEDGVKVVAVTATGGEYKDSITGRAKEEENAARILGINSLLNLNFPCSRLTEKIAELREKIECIVKEIKPDVGYTIYPHDLHIDHQIVSQQSAIAMRSVLNLIYYRVAYSNSFSPNLFFFGNENLIRAKIKALKCFGQEVKKSGTVDLLRIKFLAKYEFNNYLHHKCIRQVENLFKSSNEKTIYCEPFHIHRFIDI